MNKYQIPTGAIVPIDFQPQQKYILKNKISNKFKEEYFNQK